MKWVVFIVAMAASHSMGRHLRDRPRWLVYAWIAVGALPMVYARDVAVYSFGTRPGDTNGLEFSLLDCVSVALLSAYRGEPRRPLPYRIPIVVYLLVVAFSITQAQWTLGAFGYLWKLGRMLLVVSAIWRASRDPRVVPSVMRGMTAGVVYECMLSLWQHFALGADRVTGTFAHQNTLGMVVNLTAMAPIALMLSGPVNLFTKLTPLAAIPIDVLTVSRGAILFFALGCTLVYLASIFRRWDSRKARIGFVAMAAAAVLAPVALAVVRTRPQEQQTESMNLRLQYEAAAKLMLSEHPLGIGANHFTMMLLAGGYGARAKIDWSQQTAIVHNVYWLTLAEMGYAGLVALLLLFLAPLFTALRAGFTAGRDRRGDALLGLGVALAFFYVHCLFEWAWRITSLHYTYWTSIALVAVLARQVQEARRARVAARPHAPPAGGDLGPLPGRAPHPARS